MIVDRWAVALLIAGAPALLSTSFANAAVAVARNDKAAAAANARKVAAKNDKPVAVIPWAVHADCSRSSVVREQLLHGLNVPCWQPECVFEDVVPSIGFPSCSWVQKGDSQTTKGIILPKHSLNASPRKGKCVVYGAGIAADSGFEQTMAQHCETHAFDCTTGSNSPVVVGKAFTFHRTCIGNSSHGGDDTAAQLRDSDFLSPKWNSYLDRNASLSFMPLKTIRKRLGHHTVDLLKFDIEGFEWELLRTQVMDALRHPPCMRMTGSRSSSSSSSSTSTSSSSTSSTSSDVPFFLSLFLSLSLACITCLCCCCCRCCCWCYALQVMRPGGVRPHQISFELHTKGTNPRWVSPAVLEGAHAQGAGKRAVNQLFLDLHDLGYRVVSKEVSKKVPTCAEFVVALGCGGSSSNGSGSGGVSSVAAGAAGGGVAAGSGVAAAAKRRGCFYK